MKRLIKPVNSSKAELGKHSGTSIDRSEKLTAWIVNQSTVSVWLGTLDEEDLVLNYDVDFAPNERKQLSIDSDAILAIVLEKLPPENEALFFANGDSLEPVIQIADDTDYIGYPIRIGIAADIFNRLGSEDYDIIILQESKY